MEKKNYFIFSAIILVIGLVGLIYFFSNQPDENVCFETIMEEIDRSDRMVNAWTKNPPKEWATTKVERLDLQVELSELQVNLAQTALEALVIKNDEYRNICDYYFDNFELRLK